jgi:alanyl-tRNA synthetase
MNDMTPDRIRQTFLDFFEARDHTVVASASLIPENDPTLLFTGAGMNQFKELFLGRGEKPYSRAASSQKCFRTADLEEVGRTTYHHTFFEMLGNFSFGDYFKHDAIVWAWEFLTEVMGIPADRLWVSVYRDDDEAHDVWRDVAKVPGQRIRRFGAKTNFWPANAPEDGPNGVCGPCSEIFYDYGPEHGPDPAPDADDYEGPRFSEVWNLVFTQFNRTGRNQLEPLPQKNIDTGMGFERLVAVVRGKLSTFQTELFVPIIEEVSRLSGIPYRYEAPEGVKMRRIADHVRAAVFCLLDGVKPGRDGRSFVLRRVIRRAVRDGIVLGMERPFLAELAPVVEKVMGAAYPGIRDGLDEIRSHLLAEEERFRSTYFQGMNALESAVEKLRRSGDTVLPGEAAFRLHDERGFPVDLTEDYLREQGLGFDREGFDRAMEARRRESQDRSAMEEDIFALGPLAEIRSEHGETTFTGYEGTEDEGTVLGIMREGVRAESAEAGERVSIVTDRTPFYSEAGGQIGDAGEVVGPGGRVSIEDAKAGDGVTSMIGEVTEGTVRVGERVRLVVDPARRDAIRRNHTATHLLHRALRDRLGEHVRQAGSLVAPDRLRFDFHHGEAATPEQLRAIEEDVNREILANTPVGTAVRDFDEAREAGAMALFGEKYGDEVRVVSVGDYSLELCGGTHCRATGEIGSLRIVSESAIGAGLRRIEAVTGLGSLGLMDRDRGILRDLVTKLKARPEELAARIDGMRAEQQELRKKLDQALAGSSAAGPETRRETLENGVEVRFEQYSGPFEMKHLLEGADRIRGEGGLVAGLLCTETDGGLSLVVVATPDLVAAGFHAGNAVKEVAGAMGGGGGGRPDLGQGKGRNPAALSRALEILRANAGELSIG